MSVSSLMLLSIAITNAGVSSSNYLPVGGLLDHADNSTTTISFPSQIPIDNELIATGPQTLNVSVSADSTTSLQIDLKSHKESIAPGQSRNFEIDFAYGQEKVEYDLAPSPATDGSVVKYSISIPNLKSIYNAEGWQELYSNPSGCQSDSGCTTKAPYGQFSTSRIFFNKPSQWRCSISGVPNDQKSCNYDELHPASKKCPSGYSNYGSRCAKTIVRSPNVSLKCPSSHRYKDSTLDLTASSVCYSSYKEPSCPSGTYYFEGQECTASVSFVGQGDRFSSFKCPSSKPHLLQSNDKQYYCSSYPSFMASSYCEAGYHYGGIGSSNSCYGGSTASPISVSSCLSGYTERYDGKCEKTVYANHTYTCNSGTLTNGNQCRVVVNGGEAIEYCDDSSVSPKSHRCIGETPSSHEPKSGVQTINKYSTKLWVK